MSEDEKIFEMAKLITEGARSAVEDADALYNAGYRKATEVAREIFEEIEETLAHHYEEWDFCYYDDYLGGDIAELKKKYIGETQMSLPTRRMGNDK